MFINFNINILKVVVNTYIQLLFLFRVYTTQSDPRKDE